MGYGIIIMIVYFTQQKIFLQMERMLMYTFKDLRKNSNQKPTGNSRRLAMLGNVSTQFLSVAIRGYAVLENLPLEVFDTDYNQIEAQLLDPVSEVYGFSPDSILLWLGTDKLYEEFLDLPLEARSGFAETIMSKITMYWELISKNCKANILQMNFTEIDDKALGNYSAKADTAFAFQIRKLNYLLEGAMSKQNNVYPIDLLSVQIQFGTEKFYDAPLYYNAKMTISTDALPFAAKTVIDVLKALSGRIKKCVVLDLDNTLWGGVIGDDGMENIEIGELGRGHVFTDFQRWLKQLKECGIILCICSKNNEDTAKKPFEEHDEMILRLSDIALFVANWEDKASNIRLIQKTLNIGMDSMVFIDDNPFERNLVRQMIPEIEVPELPEDPALYLGYLQQQNYFETASFTGAGSDRTKLYQAEFERTKLMMSFDSIDGYLESLEMEGEAKPFEESKYSRIAQLTQRSNQFNLRTVRYTESDIQNIANDKDYLTIYYNLKDKFGDHGLVGVIIMKKRSDTELFIDTWLMSCRVLKRGMEEFIVNQLIKRAKANGFKKVYGEYISTPKNSMVKDIYKTMGFEEISEDQYVTDVDTYKEKKIYIKEIDQ